MQTMQVYENGAISTPRAFWVLQALGAGWRDASREDAEDFEFEVSPSIPVDYMRKAAGEAVGWIDAVG
jgi:hypothetical protein